MSSICCLFIVYLVTRVASGRGQPGAHVFTLNSTLFHSAWCFLGGSLLPQEAGHRPCWPHALAGTECLGVSRRHGKYMGGETEEAGGWEGGGHKVESPEEITWKLFLK